MSLTWLSILLHIGTIKVPREVSLDGTFCQNHLVCSKLYKNTSSSTHKNASMRLWGGKKPVVWEGKYSNTNSSKFNAQLWYICHSVYCCQDWVCCPSYSPTQYREQEQAWSALRDQMCSAEFKNCFFLSWNKCIKQSGSHWCLSNISMYLKVPSVWTNR